VHRNQPGAKAEQAQRTSLVRRVQPDQSPFENPRKLRSQGFGISAEQGGLHA